MFYSNGAIPTVRGGDTRNHEQQIAQSHLAGKLRLLPADQARTGFKLSPRSKATRRGEGSNCESWREASLRSFRASLRPQSSRYTASKYLLGSPGRLWNLGSVVLRLPKLDEEHDRDGK